MELKLLNNQGQGAGFITVDEAIFARNYNEALVHQVVTAYMANARSGNRAQKTRAEVSRTGKKPWKQKGTGRARAGTAGSHLWRGGGRAFPNSPEENFTQKVNRKMYRAALATIISKLIADERLVVAENLEISSPKTKNFVSVMKNMLIEAKSILLIVDELTENVWLASRNLPNILILESHQVDPYSLLRCDKVVVTQGAIKQLQEQWI